MHTKSHTHTHIHTVHTQMYGRGSTSSRWLSDSLSGGSAWAPCSFSVFPLPAVLALPGLACCCCHETLILRQFQKQQQPQQLYLTKFSFLSKWLHCRLPQAEHQSCTLSQQERNSWIFLFFLSSSFNVSSTTAAALVQISVLAHTFTHHHLKSSVNVNLHIPNRQLGVTKFKSQRYE